MSPPTQPRRRRATAPVKTTSAALKSPAQDPSDIEAPGPVLNSGMGLEPLLTVTEVAGVLRLSIRQVRRMIAAGDLPVLRLGAVVRIRRSVLAALLRGE
jgi:excisionase family DNA binding protein